MSSFYTTIVIEALQGCKNISSEIVTRFLPFVLHGLNLNVGRDYRAGTLMIIATLIHRVQLGDQVVVDILEGLSMSSNEMLEDVLLLMLQVARSQVKQNAIFPHKAFTHLARQPGLVTALTDIGTTFDVEPLLKPFTGALAQRLFAHENYRVLMVSMIKSLPIGSFLHLTLQNLVEHVVEESTKPSSTDLQNAESLLTAMDDVLAAMRSRFPNELDNAINRILSNARDALQSSYNERDAAVVRVLKGWLGNSVFKPIDGKHISLLSALQPTAKTKTRLIALEELHKLAKAEHADVTSMRMQLEEVLLKNITEEANHKIVTSTLTVYMLH